MSRSRAKGTDWERAIIEYLKTRGWPNAERRALAGNLDRGDVAGVIGVVIEAKNAARVELASWLDEANEEARNAKVYLGVVWFHRKGKGSPGQGYVLMDGHTFTKLLTEAGYR